MLETTRKHKKNKKKLIIRIILLAFFVMLSVSIGIYLYVLKIKRPLYISPLSPNFTFNSSQSQNKTEESLKESIKDMHLDLENVAYQDGKYTITLKNKSRILLAGNKDIKQQLSSLQFILTRLTMEGKLFTQLDLRFDKPVIRLK